MQDSNSKENSGVDNKGQKRRATANRVDGSARNLTECASHTTVRTGLVYGGS